MSPHKNKLLLFCIIPKWSQNDPRVIQKWSTIIRKCSKHLPTWSQHDPEMIPEWPKNSKHIIPKWSQQYPKITHTYNTHFQTYSTHIQKWSTHIKQHLNKYWLDGMGWLDGLTGWIDWRDWLDGLDWVTGWSDWIDWTDWLDWLGFIYQKEPTLEKGLVFIYQNKRC